MSYGVPVADKALQPVGFAGGRALAA